VTFLNLIMLAGLVLVAAPVVIHLLNRHKAKAVEWAAMRFLLASLLAQRRRLLLEEIVLLALRCLLIAAVVMAMARPFLPTRAALPWSLVLLFFSGAAICAGTAGAVWKSVTLRRRLLLATASLLTIGILAAGVQGWLLKQAWFTPSGERDVVIIIDGSDSMRVNLDGRPLFQHAIEEAAAIIEKLNPGDAAGIILAGAQPRALVKSTTQDHAALQGILHHPEFKPAGGAMGVLESLNAAAAMLAESQNPIRRVILITDGQALNWDPQNVPRWSYLAQRLKALTPPPKLVCRILAPPPTYRNAGISGVHISRQVIGLDRPVEFEVTVRNSGLLPVLPGAVAFTVDDQAAGRESFAKELPPGASETVRFEHRFDKPGRHVTGFQLAYDDDLAADNVDSRAVDVLERLPVLIVNGASGSRPFETPAGLIQLALAPAASNDPALRSLIEPTVAEAADAALIDDLFRFRAIVLADVPRLPQAFANKLLAFVHNGGGLLVTAGSQVEAGFYNAFTSRAGEPFIPATFEARHTQPTGKTPLHLDLKSFTHPALRLVADTSHSDAGTQIIHAWWKLATDPRDASVHVCGQLENGDSFLVEREFGRGFVMLSALSLGAADSSLPAAKAYVPLIHEMVYYLAAPAACESNVKPGTEVAFELVQGAPRQLCNTSSAKPRSLSETREAPVVLPDGQQGAGLLIATGDHAVVRFSETLAPGLYRIQLPGNARAAAGGQDSLPFTVLRPPEESVLTRLSDADFASVRAQVDILPVRGQTEAIAAMGGGFPGLEIWKHLALIAFAAALAETALCRWIARQRRVHSAETVVLTTPADDLRARVARAQHLITATAQMKKQAVNRL